MFTYDMGLEAVALRVLVSVITTWNVHISDLLHNLDRRVPTTMPIEQRKAKELFYFRLDLISISAIITSSSILWCSKQLWVDGLVENACGMVACTVVVAILAFMNGVSDPVADANSAKAMVAFEASKTRAKSAQEDDAEADAAMAEEEEEEAAEEEAAGDVGDFPGVEPFNPGFFLIKIVFMVQFFFLFGHMMYVTPDEYTATTRVVWLTYLPGFIVYGCGKLSDWAARLPWGPHEIFHCIILAGHLSTIFMDIATGEDAVWDSWAYPDCTAANASLIPACMAESYCMSVKDDMASTMNRGVNMMGGEGPHAAAAAAAAGMAMSSTVQ